MSGLLGLVSLEGSACTKRWRPDGSVDSYGKVTWWRPLEARGIDGISALYAALVRLRARPDMIVVRGSLVDPTATRIRRAQYGDYAGLRDGDRSWMCCDLDTLEVPEDIREAFAGERGIEEAGRWARDLLPEWLRGAVMVAQWSASAGRDGFAKAKLHLWAWLSRPVCCASLAAYASTEPILDPAVCRPCQPIYTADPIVEDGFSVPTQRIALLPGTLADPPDSCLSLAQWEGQRRAEQASREAEARRYAEAARYRSPLANMRRGELRLERVIQRHCDAFAGAGEGGRHAALVSAARAIVETAREVACDPSHGLDMLRAIARSKLPQNRHSEADAVIAHTTRGYR